MNVKYYKIIIPAGESALALLMGLLVAISLLVVSLSFGIGSSSNSSINFFFNSTFLIHGGDQARHLGVDKSLWEEEEVAIAAMAGLILGLVPRLDGGVSLLGIGRGGVVILRTEASFFTSEIVAIVSVAAVVVLLKVMVTVVVLLGFGATILGSNKARRCATETLQPSKLLSDIFGTNGSFLGSDFLRVDSFALVWKNKQNIETTIFKE